LKDGLLSASRQYSDFWGAERFGERKHETYEERAGNERGYKRVWVTTESEGAESNEEADGKDGREGKKARHLEAQLEILGQQGASDILRFHKRLA
jgi:hypothetical protein